MESVIECEYFHWYRCICLASGGRVVESIAETEVAQWEGAPPLFWNNTRTVGFASLQPVMVRVLCSACETEEELESEIRNVLRLCDGAPLQWWLTLFCPSVELHGQVLRTHGFTHSYDVYYMVFDLEGDLPATQSSWSVRTVDNSDHDEMRRFVAAAGRVFYGDVENFEEYCALLRGTCASTGTTRGLQRWNNFYVDAKDDADRACIVGTLTMSLFNCSEVAIGGRFNVQAGSGVEIGRFAAIRNVTTNALHRRKGIASALMCTALFRAKEADCTHVILQADAPAVSLYGKLGFRTLCSVAKWAK